MCLEHSGAAEGVGSVAGEQVLRVGGGRDLILVTFSWSDEQLWLSRLWNFPLMQCSSMLGREPVASCAIRCIQLPDL